jgi:hypothetical protein
MLFVYESLKWVAGPAIDDLNRPSFVEAPQLMVVTIAGAIQGGLVVLYLVGIRIRRGKRYDSVHYYTMREQNVD